MHSTVILIVLGVICLIGAGLVMWYAFTYDKPRKHAESPAPPLPGSEGGGTYLMHTADLHTADDKNRLESALNALPGIHAAADPAAGAVTSRYEGFPAIDLLDTLRKTAEDAGFSVTSME